MKVLLADAMSQQFIKDITNIGYIVEAEFSLQGAALVAHIQHTQPDILVVRSTKVPPEALEASRLILIIRAGAGVNNIDIETASRLGIFVSNCPGKNAIAVAELVMGHIIALDRHIVDATIDLRNGLWNKKKYSVAKGLWGRTLGIVGVGNIGKALISRARAFGLNVVAWSKSLTPMRAKELGVTYAKDILELASQSDIVSLHLALTPETTGLIGKDFFDAMQHDSYLINTARGALIDEPTLLDAIAHKNIRSAHDVWTNQPAQSTDKIEDTLATRPEIYGTPHIGASTDQAQEAISDETLNILRVFKQSGNILNCVNITHQPPKVSLVIRHENKIGVLAETLSKIRTNHINILEMQNVLFEGAHSACANIQLNKAPSESLLEKLRETKSIISIQVVSS